MTDIIKRISCVLAVTITAFYIVGALIVLDWNWWMVIKMESRAITVVLWWMATMWGFLAAIPTKGDDE